MKITNKEELTKILENLEKETLDNITLWVQDLDKKGEIISKSYINFESVKINLTMALARNDEIHYITSDITKSFFTRHNNIHLTIDINCYQQSFKKFTDSL